MFTVAARPRRVPSRWVQMAAVRLAAAQMPRRQRRPAQPGEHVGPQLIQRPRIPVTAAGGAAGLLLCGGPPKVAGGGVFGGVQGGGVFGGQAEVQAGHAAGFRTRRGHEPAGPRPPMPLLRARRVGRRDSPAGGGAQLGGGLPRRPA
jgi:hypothetical protein